MHKPVVKQLQTVQSNKFSIRKIMQSTFVGARRLCFLVMTSPAFEKSLSLGTDVARIASRRLYGRIQPASKQNVLTICELLPVLLTYNLQAYVLRHDEISSDYGSCFCKLLCEQTSIIICCTIFFRFNTIVFSGAGFYSPKSVRNTDHSILNNTRQRAPWTTGMRR